MQNDSTIAIQYTSLDYVNSLNKATDIVARERKYLATVSGYPLEGTKSFVSFIIDNNYAQYVLVANEEVIGWCDIIPMSIPEFSHIGVLGMGILKDYRGKGLGRELLMKTIEHAKIKNKIEKIELHVFESNINAIKLYKKLGFTEEGKKIKARKIDGNYDNEFLMGLFF